MRSRKSDSAGGLRLIAPILTLYRDTDHDNPLMALADHTRLVATARLGHESGLPDQIPRRRSRTIGGCASSGRNSHHR
ncbi:MAG: hypothetical protein ACYDD6_08890 [Acidimicrobiales bacterium]